MQAIDNGVRKIVNALKQAGLYENSIIIFSSDNGGAGKASNYPLRDFKESVYEGGVRAVGFVHSQLIREGKAASPRTDMNR